MCNVPDLFCVHSKRYKSANETQVEIPNQGNENIFDMRLSKIHAKLTKLAWILKPGLRHEK